MGKGNSDWKREVRRLDSDWSKSKENKFGGFLRETETVEEDWNRTRLRKTRKKKMKIDLRFVGGWDFEIGRAHV